MANQTLTGCVKFPSGQVIFDQDDCEYTGCMIWSGTHAGQVAVTILTDKCDDTYYGCVNFPGGTFSVVVPDNCCVELGIDCANCTINETPKFITLELADFTQAPCTSLGIGPNQSSHLLEDITSIVNGTHILEQTTACRWRKTHTFDVHTVQYLSADCSGPSGEILSFSLIRFQIQRTPTTVRVEVLSSFGFVYDYTCTVGGCVCEGSPVSLETDRYLENGTATWCEGIKIGGCP